MTVGGKKTSSWLDFVHGWCSEIHEQLGEATEALCCRSVGLNFAPVIADGPRFQVTKEQRVSGGMRKNLKD